MVAEIRHTQRDAGALRAPYQQGAVRHGARLLPSPRALPKRDRALSCCLRRDG